ncbi:hypothetical protein [Paenibacillus montanisoli]|uniref:Uncharacterized protein n=1 Tax=Paenibacillus montanisoli TaxID=2081970 RepID=A0A328TVP9_9BACL|nr:hypothetical protein [Paenibacillus montanisoli]RAP73712.1 hypothetical protein DL346_25955 [Paenibacillus montanisoli]
MKKKAKFTVLSLALATSLTVPAIVGASGEVPTTNSQMVNQTNDRIGITPFVIGNQWSGNTSGAKITSTSFVVPGGYGHVKLYFNNKGTSDAIISVTHVDTNKVYFTQTVKPGTSFTWRSLTAYPQGMRAGSYIVSYRSSSANVNVDYAGFASDNEDEVNG